MELSFYITSGEHTVYESESQQVAVDLMKHFAFDDDTVDVSITDLYRASLKLKMLHGYHLFDEMMDELTPFAEWCEHLYGLAVTAAYLNKDMELTTCKDYRLVVVEDWQEGEDYVCSESSH